MAAVLSLTQTMPQPLGTTMWWLWMPVPLALMLDIMKVCSMPSQKSILICLMWAGRSLVATAMWELIPVRPMDTSPGCGTHRPAAPFIPLCDRVTDSV